MYEGWDLDPPTVEEEIFKKENEEADLKRKRFNWLSHDNRGASYISYNQFSHLPATSFEFGADGFAGACNSGGELLHFSAPSKEHGLIFARGGFSNSLYACISRAQMEYGGSATFGLRIASSEASSFRLGEMIERGCFNYRWPLNEYSLFLTKSLESKDDQSIKAQPDAEANQDIEAGTCTRFSYFENGICYQVIRLEAQGGRDVDQEEGDTYYLPPWDGQVVLEIGGSIYFQLLRSITATSSEDNSSNVYIKDDSSADCLRIMDTNLNIGLEVRVYQLNVDGNGVTALNLNRPRNKATSRTPLSSSSGVSLSKSTPTTQTSYATSSTDGGSNDEAPFHLVYEATAKLHPPSNKTGGYRRSETFIAAIRLIQGASSTTSSEAPEIPSSEDMHQSVWVEPARGPFELESQATGVMWETILQWRDLHTDSMSEFTEISLMARCLEKILQVDLVPGFYNTRTETATETKKKALAVISNPFMHPTVSLRSLFWKVRFLVKMHHFLAGLEKYSNGHTSPKISNEKDEKAEKQKVERADSIPEVPAFFSEFDGYDRTQMLNIATSQCNRIQDAIEHIVFFLVELLAPSKPNAEEGYLTHLLRPQCRTDQSEFYYITMTIWYVVKSFRKTKWKSPSRLRNFTQVDMTNSCIPPDNHNFGAVDKRKISLLKWYHYGSLLSLADRDVLPSYWRSSTMKKRVYSLSNAATMACTGSTASNSHYSVDDEIVDRLSFIANELGMEEFDATAETVTSTSIQRVRGREFTKYLNPGVSLPNGRGYSFQETSGPWEIHALCHNSRIHILTLESDSEYVKATRNCRGTNETREEEVAMYKNKVYRFLNSEVTLIPCWERSPTKMRSGWLQSEAAAVHGSTLLDIHNRIPVIPKLSPKNSPQTGPIVNLEARHHRRQATDLIMDSPDGFVKGALSTQLREVLMGLNRVDVRPINWTSFRPPRQYYPDNFINSLEDTPHLFRPPVTNNVFVPTTLAEFAERPDSRGFTRGNLEDALKDTWQSFSISDILVFQQTSSSRKRGVYRGTNTKLPDMRYYHCGASNVHGQKTLIEIFTKKKDLVTALYDSLVDQSVQHRILHIRHLSKSLIRMLVFVIHPEAAMCLSNHILNTPRFSLHKESTWMMSVTVGSWILTNTERTPPKHSSVMANESVKLPPELEATASQNAKDNKSTLTQSGYRVSFFASSVVLTTNAFGDFSRCSVISDIDDENIIKEKLDEQVEVAEISNEIWQYRDTIKEFESIVSSTNTFLIQELDWKQDTTSLSQFQLILWNLGCLCKFQNSLKTSITNIHDAKRELLDQIHKQAENRSESLQGLCQEYIANFESDVLELTQVNEYLESNVASAVRFKDALSSTLALRDSRVGLTQNNAIQALTYLTIGYLPLGLITAIFAIPMEQNVVFQGMGKGWFIGAIFIMSAVTYLVVAWLNTIIKFSRSLPTSVLRAWEPLFKEWEGFKDRIHQHPHSQDASPC
ncbi:hypothetical protein F4825DRAFT_472164 [Nemania diffusa]|nr:hypothetical protein F4825DRAFT_472164 [Nemania diffusa]